MARPFIDGMGLLVHSYCKQFMPVLVSVGSALTQQ